MRIKFFKELVVVTSLVLSITNLSACDLNQDSEQSLQKGSQATATGVIGPHVIYSIAEVWDHVSHMQKTKRVQAYWILKHALLPEIALTCALLYQPRIVVAADFDRTLNSAGPRSGFIPREGENTLNFIKEVNDREMMGCIMTSRLRGYSKNHPRNTSMNFTQMFGYALKDLSQMNPFKFGAIKNKDYQEFEISAKGTVSYGMTQDQYAFLGAQKALGLRYLIENKMLHECDVIVTIDDDGTVIQNFIDVYEALHAEGKEVTEKVILFHYPFF